jgi:hypothetical protein
VRTEGNMAPTRWDSLKYYLAIALIVTYLPAGVVASSYFGPSGGIAAFIAVTVGTMLLRCSNCSLSLFYNGKLWIPWPWRSCPKCAYSLVPQTQNGEGSERNGAQAPPNKSFERTRER